MYLILTSQVMILGTTTSRQTNPAWSTPGLYAKFNPCFLHSLTTPVPTPFIQGQEKKKPMSIEAIKRPVLLLKVGSLMQYSLQIKEFKVKVY